MLIKRSNAKVRRIALSLIFAFLAGGVFALYVLPHITGTHYDYGDVALVRDGNWEFVPMDFRFITNHLGLAVCVGSVLADFILRNYKLFWVAVLGFLVPPIGEVTFRFPRWQSVFEILFGNDSRKTQSSIVPEIVASIGPSIVASVFLLVSLAVLSRRITYDNGAISKKCLTRQ